MLIYFPALLIAMVFHEYAHGWVAKKWGDTTAQDMGRLTLNPVPHIDPVWTIIVPLIFFLMPGGLIFGGAKPVPIDPRNFRKFRPGLFWVSIAGVTMNLLLATLAAVFLVVFSIYVPSDFSLHRPLTLMAYSGIMVNCSLALFNLLPIPPLDGSRVVESVLPLKYLKHYEDFARHGAMILLVLLIIPGSPLQYLGLGIQWLGNGILSIVEMGFLSLGLLGGHSAIGGGHA